MFKEKEDVLKSLWWGSQDTPETRSSKAAAPLPFLLSSGVEKEPKMTQPRDHSPESSQATAAHSQELKVTVLL